MTWSMHIEPTPGSPTAMEGPSPEALKKIARDVWMAYPRPSKAVFTIHDPGGCPWQRCERTAGGSWRATWEWL